MAYLRNGLQVSVLECLSVGGREPAGGSSCRSSCPSPVVIPANAGIPGWLRWVARMDSRLRGNHALAGRTGRPAWASAGVGWASAHRARCLMRGRWAEAHPTVHFGAEYTCLPPTQVPSTL